MANRLSCASRWCATPQHRINLRQPGVLRSIDRSRATRRQSAQHRGACLGRVKRRSCLKWRKSGVAPAFTNGFNRNMAPWEQRIGIDQRGALRALIDIGNNSHFGSGRTMRRDQRTIADRIKLRRQGNRCLTMRGQPARRDRPRGPGARGIAIGQRLGLGRWSNTVTHHDHHPFQRGVIARCC